MVLVLASKGDKMATGKVYSCFCCGSEVTSPYFFKGAVYGYTCIKKVDPSAKRPKDNGLWLSYDELVINQPDVNRSRFEVVVIAKGLKFSIGFIYDRANLASLKDLAIESKLFKVAESKEGTKPLYALKDSGLQFHYDNKINKYGDSDGKLTRVTIKGEQVA